MRLVVAAIVAIAALISGIAAAQTSPWSAGGTLQAGELAALIVEGPSGAGTGYELAVVDYDGDGELDLVIAEPWSDQGDGTAAGRIGIFLGPLDTEALGGSPGEPLVVTLDDADEVLLGPSGARFGTELICHPAGAAGPALAVGAPGATGAEKAQAVDPPAARVHTGEVWLIDGSGSAAQGEIDAAERLWGRLWWDGWVHEEQGGEVLARLPLDLGTTMARIPDLDGDGVDELAVTAGTLLHIDAPPATPAEPLQVGGGIYRGGVVMVVPGSRVLGGLDQAVDHAWVLGVQHDPPATPYPFAGQALLGGPPGRPDGLVVGDAAEMWLEGRAILVGPQEMASTITLDPLDPLAGALQADQLGGSVGGIGLAVEHWLGTSLAAVGDDQYLAVSSAQMLSWSIPRPVTSVYQAEALAELTAGQAVISAALDPLLLVGSSWSPLDVLELAEWLTTVVLAGWSDVYASYPDWTTCLDQIDVGGCLPPLLSGAALAPRLAVDMPRSTHVAVPLGSSLLIGEPTADTPYGEVYVVDGDLSDDVPYEVRLADDATWPAGWQITRILAGSQARWFGHTPLAPGDLDGDGLDDLVIGAPGRTGSPDGGRVYLLLSAPHADLDADGVSEAAGDCDDEDSAVFPGAEELCDGIDNDCNGTIDDPPDNDGDGYTECNGECDDSDTAVHPGAEEICDGVDNDCSGEIDDPADGDGDGFDLCHGDCDDGDAAIRPGAEEIADGVDNDCNGWIDDGVVSPSGCGCTDAGRPVSALLPTGIVLLWTRRNWSSCCDRHARRERRSKTDRSH